MPAAARYTPRSAAPKVDQHASPHTGCAILLRKTEGGRGAKGLWLTGRTGLFFDLLLGREDWERLRRTCRKSAPRMESGGSLCPGYAVIHRRECDSATSAVQMRGSSRKCRRRMLYDILCYTIV